jgi:energy-coupling factor transporter ATP-binding protein EcfA2
MRDWQDWLTEISKELLRLGQDDLIPVTFTKTESKRFFEVELVITLYAEIYESASYSNIKEAWSLLTNFIPNELKNNQKLIEACTRVRHRVRYIRTATAWKKSLLWYSQQPLSIRLFDISLESGTYTRQPVVNFVPQRVETINKALNEPAKHKSISRNWAKSEKEYCFYVNSEATSVFIPTKLIDGMKECLSNISTTAIPVSEKQRRSSPLSPLRIRLCDLRESAIKLEEKLPGRQWSERWKQLNSSLSLIEENLQLTNEFTINGIFHLLGPTGSGKSTLIYLLVHHLCEKYSISNQNFRICIIVNTVTDAIDMAADFIKVGLSAAPILGKARDSHQYQYGMAHADKLQPEDLYQPYNSVEDTKNAELLDNPALPWLTGKCILSGLLSEVSIPAGQEPCHNLVSPDDLKKQEKNYSNKITYHSCPLLPICPVHQANRDLVNASIWVATSAAFIYTTMPIELVGTEMRVLEAAYHYCSLLIVDEGDRVQVSIEDDFAPSNDLAGSQTAILDFIEHTIAEKSFYSGRTQLNDPRYHELRGVAREASRLSDGIFVRLFDKIHLRKWIGERPLYNSLIYEQLIESIRNLVPDNFPETDLSEVLSFLEEEFKNYYLLPSSNGLEDSETIENDLEKLVSDVRNDKGENLIKKLRIWLQERLPWHLPQSPQTQQILERLEFSVLLTAMDRQVNELVRYWLLATAELGKGLSLSQNPPEEYIDLNVESPLGHLLGYQFVDQTEEKTPRGLLRYLACFGLGRYLLLNFPYLYVNLTGDYGPHTLITSATSWSPGSPQFNIGIQPHAILSPPLEAVEALSNSYFEFIRVPDSRGEAIIVSGRSGRGRKDSLLQLTQYLAFGSGGKDRITQELDYWNSLGTPRSVILITGSYPEAQLVARELQESSRWRNRVDCLQSDRDEKIAEWLLRRGQVEQFSTRGRDLLVAPLGAVQRGYNILSPITNKAYLGSVFFLVRPYPVPTDFGRQIRAINRLVFDDILQGSNILPSSLGETAAEAIAKLRSLSYKNWHRRLRASHHGSASIDVDFWHELLWDQAVSIVQALGRATRGNVPTRVFFCDSAFYPQGAERSLLKGWVEIFGEYLSPNSNKPQVEQQLARILYGSIYDRLKALVEHLEHNSNGR